MCFFPFPNNKIDGLAYKKGIIELSCGACPECLNKRAREWALRCSMEAKSNIGMMLTLTYDDYIRDDKGHIIGERVAVEKSVDKKDVQKFVKRLRHYYPNNEIKYLITAEYGKRTHRPHYHALIFGVVFDDLIPNKKSKRGNLIYRSFTLEKIWKLGICSVDCINLNAKTARYCTKYCAKDYGVDDTFMLFSRSIGEANLLKEFNGKNYIIEGREYSIPRKIWERYIETKYSCSNKYLSYQWLADKLEKKLEPLISEDGEILRSYQSYMKRTKYIDNQLDPGEYIPDCDIHNKGYYLIREKVPCHSSQAAWIAYKRNQLKREIFRSFRDNCFLYKSYLEYWSRKAALTQYLQPTVLQRIAALPNDKYFGYKQYALNCYQSRLSHKYDIDLAEMPPRCNCVKRLGRAKEIYLRKIGLRSICLTHSRHLRANDSKEYKFKLTEKPSIYTALKNLCKIDKLFQN